MHRTKGNSVRHARSMPVTCIIKQAAYAGTQHGWLERADERPLGFQSVQSWSSVSTDAHKSMLLCLGEYSSMQLPT